MKDIFLNRRARRILERGEKHHPKNCIHNMELRRLRELLEPKDRYGSLRIIIEQPQTKQK